MNIYEIVFILLKNKKHINIFFSSFISIVLKNNYLILNIERWGSLIFKYSIKGHKKGYFFLFRIFVDYNFLLDLLDFFKSYNFVIRFFFIKLKKNKFSLSFDFFKKVLKHEKNIKKNKFKKKI